MTTEHAVQRWHNLKSTRNNRTRMRGSRSRTAPSRRRRLIWTILLIGLSFCFFNTVFLFYAHHHELPAEDGQQAMIRANSPEQQNFALNNDRQQHQVMLRANSPMLMNFAPNNTRSDYKDLRRGKEQIFEILGQAGIDAATLDVETLAQLPTWEQVTSMYGDQPRIHGLDSCEDYRRLIPAEDSFIAPAGAFDSGTNLMAELLIANCHIPARQKKYGWRNAGVRWQVNWGKHQSPRFRLHHSVNMDGKVPNQNILPVVTIRDPYSWLQSLCRHRYATHWFHAPGHCPNLVANEVDYEYLQYGLDKSYRTHRFLPMHRKDPWLLDNVLDTANFTVDQKIIPVYVKYKLETRNHASLVHMYNEWYQDYMDADFPRLVVRLEDLFFFGKQVTQQACACVGGEFKGKFKHIGASAKKGVIHGNSTTTLLDAIIRYSRPQNSAKGMTQEDLAFARENLSKEYMDIFHYHHPSELA